MVTHRALALGTTRAAPPPNSRLAGLTRKHTGKHILSDGLTARPRVPLVTFTCESALANLYNVYCDESGHLEHDHLPVMVLGALWCPEAARREVAVRVREIKAKHHLNPRFEAKWTKVSPAKVQFYLDLVDYFFDDDDLHFRALIVPDKTQLDHARFGQDHNTWFYKMYFEMLKTILDPKAQYFIYLDIKDTRGAAKVAKLWDVLCNNIYDFSRDVIRRVQLVHSAEVEQIQLADLLIGSISYANRGLATSSAKTKIVERIKARSGYSLTASTLLRESKVNVFRWQAATNE